MTRVLLVCVCLVVTACRGTTEPSVDPATAPVDGTYALTAQGLAPGAPVLTTQDVTTFTADLHVLSGGAWTRTYSAVSASPDGTRRPFSGTMTGTYRRADAVITLQRAGHPDYTAQFTGRGMVLREGDYLLTYVLR